MRYALPIFAMISCLAACDRDSSGVMQEIRRTEQERLRRQTANTARSERFIEEKRRARGARSTASGLVYEVTRPPPDPDLPRPPSDAQWAEVNYEGRLPDGTVFDSSEQHGGPVRIPLAHIVPGFREALLLMRPGQEVVAYLPPDLAYGERGAPPTIPPNAALQFRIELIAYARLDGNVVAAPAR